jgi:hypothetical protein
MLKQSTRRPAIAHNSPWRFALRTLLIPTTLVAIAPGLIVAVV